MTNDESNPNDQITNDQNRFGHSSFEHSNIDSSFVIRHSSLTDAVAQLLAAADAEIAAKNPVCKNSGKCCQFEKYGHRLYVTAVELLHFAQIHVPTHTIENRKSKIENNSVSLPQFFAREKPTGCPYQINGLCTARTARPLGCRVYFCDTNAQSWQNDLYEKYHKELQSLHAQFNIPYEYTEWRHALRTLLEAEKNT